MDMTRDSKLAQWQEGNADLQRQLVQAQAERDEALAREAAVAEVLEAINHSTLDLTAILQSIVSIAYRLCHADQAVLFRNVDGKYRWAAGRDMSPGSAESERNAIILPGRGTLIGRTALARQAVQITDAWNDSDYENQGDARAAGTRSMLGVPLLREGVVIGAIGLARNRVEPFSDREARLVATFANQAVIAIESARLIGETREALEQQTATADVLQVINSSPGDLTPVFDTILDKAHRLCGASRGTLFLFDGKTFRAAAIHGYPPPAEGTPPRTISVAEDPRLAALLAGERLIHVPDLTQIGDPIARAVAERGGVRTNLLLPLRRESALLGVISCNRHEVQPFSDKDIALLENFAQQAVIAMENARLLTETREALDQQTATAEVLQVINASPGDLAPVFDAMLEKAVRLCDGTQGIFWTFNADLFQAAAFLGVNPAFAVALREPVQLPPDSPLGRVAHGEPFVQILDMADTDAYRSGHPLVHAVVELGKVRSLAVVPLIKDETAAGIFAVARNEVRPFTDKQIALLQNFAAQAVIATENARLITETQEARDVAEAALRDLQAAQRNLIQAEKMASLGQLTAGIAHEIKNPLNFVNNFASLSTELLGELKEEAAPALATLGATQREGIDETIDLLTGNLNKIVEHGQRADNIVKSMLEHSRGASGERREVDLNNLIGEALNLAYHGARAQDQSFNISLENDYEPMLKPIEVAPQEMTRVFLNLISNGFYAANKRARETDDGAFLPLLKVTTRDLGAMVEVRVRDNGTGIPTDIRDKLFQPFFTTKPTGEGTGLGLSISYDIVTQQHGGTIEVDSEEGRFTEFTIRLPRRGGAASAVASG